MGLRRLRGRLDQLQGAANLTLQDARDLLADLSDGFGISITVDAGAVKTLVDMFLAGQSVTLPIRISIDPTIDTKE